MEDREWLKSTAPADAAAPAAEEGAELVTRDYKVEVSGKLFDVKVIGEAVAGGAAPRGGRQETAEARAQGRRRRRRLERVAPLAPAGHRLKVAVEQGAEVAEGDLICVIEAMKMENEIVAHRAGKVEELKVAEGAAVSSGDVLAVIK